VSAELDDALAMAMLGPGTAVGRGSALAGPGQLGASGAPLQLMDLARLLGGYRWVERRLFEVVGGWVAYEAVPQARVLFDVLAQQHAWHAELWEERLPALDGVDPDTLTVPPSAQVDRLLLAVATSTTPRGEGGVAPVVVGSTAGPEGRGGTLPRLVGLGRVVLPRLVAGYGLHLRRAEPLAEAPVIRTLRLVRQDEIEAWQAVEAAIEALVRRPHDVEAITTHQQALEALVAADGPGLVPWPRRPVDAEGGAGPAGEDDRAS